MLSPQGSFSEKGVPAVQNRFIINKYFNFTLLYATENHISLFFRRLFRAREVTILLKDSKNKKSRKTNALMTVDALVRYST